MKNLFFCSILGLLTSLSGFGCFISSFAKSARGYLKIDDIDLSSPVLKKADGKGTPYLEKSAKGARVDNFVVYLNDDSLEKYYSSVDSYNNSASGFISFSDLKTDYNFKVIGAFYTNTKASDDNGYVFPYNVTEQMEPSSALEFYTMLHYRFLYNTGASPIRSDKLITISCPTSYHKDFRFVVLSFSAVITIWGCHGLAEAK